MVASQGQKYKTAPKECQNNTQQQQQKTSKQQENLHKNSCFSYLQHTSTRHL